MRNEQYQNMSFDELRSRRSSESEQQGRSTGFFEREWEVFVARYDKRSGKYVTCTSCCEYSPVCTS